MADIFFYHLEHQPLEIVLPSLLEKTLERGWRAVIESDNETRLETLNNSLWTYDEESFLPHCLSASEKAEVTPIILSADEDNKNNAQVRFFLDGAKPDDVSDYERVVFIFDGRDEDAVSRARDLWKKYQGSENEPTYWQQNLQGGWEKKA